MLKGKTMYKVVPTMTDAELDQLEALANAATPGPWDCTVRGHHQWVCLREDEHGFLGARDEDAAFIATARTAVPALIAEIRALQRANANMRENWARDVETRNGIIRATQERSATGADLNIASAIAAGKLAMRGISSNPEDWDEEDQESEGEDIARGILRAAGVKL